jgi:hypothetical protein
MRIDHSRLISMLSYLPLIYMLMCLSYFRTSFSQEREFWMLALVLEFFALLFMSVSRQIHPLERKSSVLSILITYVNRPSEILRNHTANN